MTEILLTQNPLTALGGRTPRVDTVGHLTLTENPDLALASVTARQGQEAACQHHLVALLDAVPAPGRATERADEAGFWIGPDAWMIATTLARDADLAAALKQRFGESASITEQTDGWVVFDLQGEGIVAAMELLCPVDLRRMDPGGVQRTTLDHLGCFVWWRGQEAGLRILGPRSAAGSLHHALLTAMGAI
ncbi:sarcosine oxidase subunit gamma [Dinoroseobacter sp. S124A]|uniref:sarcosine oxidase subunit gamma n=1 Tax=Dinoroseobacter sp. S124A TaxID=3415128 RepID=UPI003C79E257